MVHPMVEYCPKPQVKVQLLQGFELEEELYVPGKHDAQTRSVVGVHAPVK